MAETTIQLTSVKPFSGITTQFAQPSLLLQFSFASAVPAPRVALSAVLQRLLQLEQPIEILGSDLSEQYAAAFLGVLAQLGCPQFSSPKVSGNSHSKQIWVGVVEGLHNYVVRLAKQLIELFEQLCSEPSTAPPTPLRALVDQIRRQLPLGKNTLPMLEAAHKLAIPWRRIIGNQYQFGQGSKQHWFDSSLSDQTPAIGVSLVQDKLAATAILRDAGFPVAKNGAALDLKQACHVAQQLGYPVVVKPADRDRGEGVHINLLDQDALECAFIAAGKVSNKLLVEKMTAGRDYRIHVLKGRAYRVRMRTPASVVGDGKQTVEQLVRQFNLSLVKQRSGERYNKISLDSEALDLLVEQGISAGTVPALGDRVFLKRIANVTTGGETHPVVLSDIHPDNLRLAEQAVQLFNLDIAAVDFLCADIQRSWREVGGTICEINARPQFGADAPYALFKAFFPTGATIPVAVMVAVAQPEQLQIELARRLLERGVRLGSYSAGVVRVAGESLPVGRPLSAFAAAVMLQRRRDVDAMLIDADDSLIREGMPCRVVDVTLAPAAQLGSEKLLAAVNAVSQKRLDIDWPNGGAEQLSQIEEHLISCAQIEIN